MHILLRLVMSNVLLRRIACADELDVLSVTELHQNSGSFERAASRSRSAPKSPVDAWQADTVTTAAAGLDEGLGRSVRVRGELRVAHPVPLQLRFNGSVTSG